MLKQISIDNYFNSNNTAQIGCIDIPIAGLAGSYSYNYYFYYCFLVAINSNWGNSKYNDFLPAGNSILSKFGLTLKKYIIESSDDLIPFIKESVDQYRPILWITNYYKLMYSLYYINESDASYHGTIIRDY